MPHSDLICNSNEDAPNAAADVRMTLRNQLYVSDFNEKIYHKFNLEKKEAQIKQKKHNVTWIL